MNNQEIREVFILTSLENNLKKQVFKAAEKVRSAHTISDAVVLAVYGASLMAETNSTYKVAIEKKCKDEILKEYLLAPANKNLESAAEALVDVCRQVSAEEILRSDLLVDVMASSSWDSITPVCLGKLADCLLDVGENDTVADFGCGKGIALSELGHATKNPVTGYEIHQESAMVARAMLSAFEIKHEIISGDLFFTSIGSEYSKIFTAPPIGIRSAGFLREKCVKELGLPEDVVVRDSTSACWLFILASLNALKEGGKAMALIHSGALSNMMDKDLKKYLIDNHLIEAVISLPENLIPGTSISTTAILLSRDNHQVRFVDATDLVLFGRRVKTLGSDEILEIKERLITDSEMSHTESCEEIINKDYNLLPQRYLVSKIALVNPTPISAVVTDVKRGSTHSASKLDELATEMHTGYKYVQLKDIEDGLINDDLVNLESLDQKSMNICLKDKDIIISKIGPNFKVAVADVEEDEFILPTGNVYILSVDKEVANPYYVAAFLASYTGQELLGSIAAGTTFPSIPLGELKELEISIPPLELQDAIAQDYEDKLEEIKTYKEFLKQSRMEIPEIYCKAVTR